jgi:hypothetical protein
MGDSTASRRYIKMSRMSAYCKGFLMTKNSSVESATLYCKGFLSEYNSNGNGFY